MIILRVRYHTLLTATEKTQTPKKGKKILVKKERQ